MGKKTLEEIGKILLVSIISILITTITARRVLLDSKLDKSEFKEYKAEHKDQHRREYETIKEVRSMVLFLYENEIKKGD